MKPKRDQRVSNVGNMAEEAKEDIKRLANAKKRQFTAAMSDNGGETEER